MYNYVDYTTTALRALHKEYLIRIFIGLVLSFLIHLLIWWLVTTNFEELKFLPPKKQEKKISLNIQQVFTPTPKPKPMPKPIISPPILKPIVEKKVEPKVEVEEVKRTIIDERKKTFATKSTTDNNVTKVVEEPVKKVVKKEVKKKPKKKIEKKIIKKKTIQKKRIVKKKPVKRKAKRSKDPLANMLMGSGTSLAPQPRRSSNLWYLWRENHKTTLWK